MCGIIIFFSSFRPYAGQVLCHCLFWIEKKQLEFFREVSSYTNDKVHLAFDAIDVDSSTVFNGCWRVCITSNQTSKPEEDYISNYLSSGQFLTSIFN